MRISGVTFATRKTHRSRNVVLTILVLLIVVILATVAISAYQAWHLLHPERKNLEAFSSNIVPDYRDVTFKSSDKAAVLDGWLFETGSDKTVILVHSQGENRLQFGLQTVDIIKQLLAKKYNVLAFDLRNSGTSGGKESTFGSTEKYDIIGAINYVRQQGAKHVVLMGYYTGASASLLAAEESGNVDAVVADSPYSTLEGYMQSSLDNLSKLPSIPFNEAINLSIEVMFGIDTGNVSPLAELGSLKKTTGLLFIHSKNDIMIPVQNSIDLFNASKTFNMDNTELWETDAGGSASSYTAEPAEYMNRVFAFLDKVYQSH